MAELMIKNGSFYRGDEKIRPEFGNVEQIECIRRHEASLEEFTKGKVVEPDYDVQPIEATVYFDCVCGKNLQITADADSEEDIDCFMGEEKTCPECGRRYKLDINDDDELIVKLKTKNQYGHKRN